MKVPKTVLQGISVAIIVTVTASGCKKIDFLKPDKAKTEQKDKDACLACGRG